MIILLTVATKPKRESPMAWQFELGLDDYETRISSGLDFFWNKLSDRSWRAKNKMDGFVPLIAEIVARFGGTAGLRLLDGQPPIPSIFRPAKSWDVVVLDAHERIVAVIELKSHLGSGKDTSFEQNFNNRVEEALGTATDFHVSMPYLAPKIWKPFVGFLLLLEAHPNSLSRKPVRSNSGSAIQDPDVTQRFFHNKSTVERWEQCFESLVNGRVYDGCGLIVAKHGTVERASVPIQERFTDRYFFSALAAHLASIPG
jgi:hypothetical protein